ncbi:hypothetical protein EDD56_13914 [Pseudobacteriovorax antillogorgiicola]|nr:hypothetical protein EDD56_13914 [Pseudobacteriovorax antillogorgiicola]
MVPHQVVFLFPNIVSNLDKRGMARSLRTGCLTQLELTVKTRGERLALPLGQPDQADKGMVAS